eukprot:m.254847 g.254847  ORF g.254847 m.254847 type:complete len:117 (+) comp17556_c0_seq10:754-1104(+)
MHNKLTTWPARAIFGSINVEYGSLMSIKSSHMAVDFEAQLPATFQRPKSLDELVLFVQDKYQAKKWVKKGQRLSIAESLDDAMDEQEADNRVGASMQAEASAAHADEDPMANHDWF